MPSFTTPLLINLTLITAFGVFVHDTRIDKAMTVALAAPIALASFTATNLASKSNDHVHMERASASVNHLSALRANIDRTPPRDDDRRYVQSKKIFYGGGNNSGLWPSV